MKSSLSVSVSDQVGDVQISLSRGGLVLHREISPGDPAFYHSGSRFIEVPALQVGIFIDALVRVQAEFVRVQAASRGIAA